MPDTANTPAPDAAPAPVRATGYPHGTFSWVDLASPDPARARDFLTALFGWEAREVPMPEEAGSYTMLELHGGSVTAVGGRPDFDGPARWSSYVSVDDVDEVVAAAERLGASVAVAPMDVDPQEPIEGRMAVIVDPAGAALGLWQPGAHIGAAYVNAPGCFSWNELVLPPDADVATVQDFYAQLFDWEFEVDENDYTLIKNGGRMNGGVLPPGTAGDTPARWHVYFSVADAYASAARAEELGGALPSPAQEMPGMGHFAVVQEPTGAAFTILQFDGEPDAPPQS